MASVVDGLGDRIRRLRNARGWTLETLGERAGLRPERISVIEQGTVPKLATLEKLASGLEVELWTLFHVHPEAAQQPDLLNIITLLAGQPPNEVKRAARVVAALLSE